MWVVDFGGFFTKDSGTVGGFRCDPGGVRVGLRAEHDDPVRPHRGDRRGDRIRSGTPARATGDHVRAEGPEGFRQPWAFRQCDQAAGGPTGPHLAGRPSETLGDLGRQPLHGWIPRLRGGACRRQHVL